MVPPATRQGLSRGKLFDITNVENQRAVVKMVKKKSVATSSKYSHIQPKVDTRLRPRAPLCRAESVACSSAPAFARAALKKPNHSVDPLQASKESIEDIDGGNKNPLQMADYMIDIHRHLRHLEYKFAIAPDYMSKQTSITGRMRAVVIDWLFILISDLNMSVETFHLTVGIIDRYIQAVHIEKANLQLVGITAFFIACKYEEVYLPHLADLVYATDYSYTKEEVLKTEIDILKNLGFSIGRPTPNTFLKRFIKASHAGVLDQSLAKYFVDLSLVDHSMSQYRPSELAATAICLSLYLMSPKTLKEVWTPTMVHYSEYTLKHLYPIIKKMARVVINAENSKCTAVFDKYSRASNLAVSKLPNLKGKMIYQLAG